MMTERLLVNKALEIIKNYKDKIKNKVKPKIGRKSVTEFLEKYDFNNTIASRIHVYQKTLRYTKVLFSQKAEDDCFKAKKDLDKVLIIYAKKYIDFLYNPPMTPIEIQELIQEINKQLLFIEKHNYKSQCVII